MLGAIWAQSTDGIIGDGISMPWYLPEDLEHFKNTTQGHSVIMGRKTWESLPHKPLPQRDNYIISSRKPGAWSQGAQVVNSLPHTDDAWIIGGTQIYQHYLYKLQRIFVTMINVKLENNPHYQTISRKLPDLKSGSRSPT